MLVPFPSVLRVGKKEEEKYTDNQTEEDTRTRGFWVHHRKRHR